MNFIKAYMTQSLSFVVDRVVGVSIGNKSPCHILQLVV